MTNEQIVQKARYYAANIGLSPIRFRSQLNARERSIFDAELISYRRELVEGTAAKYSPSWTLRRHAA